MGDDERGDYLYKFVSAEKFDERRTRGPACRNKQLLTNGTLYVARLTGDGSDGRPVRRHRPVDPAVHRHRRRSCPACPWPTCCVFTRLAADKLSPTKMDRPEDVEPNPVNGKVYAALTNNSNRGSAALPGRRGQPGRVLDGARLARCAADRGVAATATATCSS